jgi:putative ABC transport system ATP-binding protein
MSVFDNVAFGLQVRHRPRAEIKQRVESTLELVGLPGLARRYPGQLSGGQQQRVALARALVNNPSIILADEPTGALDTRTSVEVMEIFQRLNRERKLTVIIVTHEPDISSYGERVIQVRDGRIASDERVLQRLEAAEVLKSLPVLSPDLEDNEE